MSHKSRPVLKFRYNLIVYKDKAIIASARGVYHRTNLKTVQHGEIHFEEYWIKLECISVITLTSPFSNQIQRVSRLDKKINHLSPSDPVDL